MKFLISKDRNYILLGDKITCISEKNTLDLKNITIMETIDIFKSQSSKLLQEDISKIVEINSLIRGLGNLISEDLTEDGDKFFLFELEKKLNNNLILESISDTILITEGVWNWIKDKAGRTWKSVKSGAKSVGKEVWNGVKWVGGKALDGLKWLWKKGLPWFFDHLREFVYSPLGIGIEIGLQATGIGEIPIVVVFGALLLWEIKELIEKGPSFWRIANVIFASLGCLPGATTLIKGVKVALKPVEAAKGLKGVSRGLIEKGINLITKSIGTILNAIGKGFKWVAGLFGKASLRWAESIVSGAERSILGATQSVAKKIGIKRGSMAISKGLRAFIVWSGVNWGLHEFLKTETGKKVALSVMEFFGAESSGGGEAQISDESILTEESIKRTFEKYNPQLSPITSLKIIKDEKTGQTDYFVVNGKNYILDETKSGIILIPKEETSNSTVDSKINPPTEKKQENIQNVNDIYKQPDYQGGGWSF